MCKLQLDFPAVAINPYSYDQAVSFLSNLFYDEKGNYWTIAVAGFSLSAILPKVNWKIFGKDESVSRMMKWIFKISPSLLKCILPPWYHSSVYGFITCKQPIIHESYPIIRETVFSRLRIKFFGIYLSSSKKDHTDSNILHEYVEIFRVYYFN